MFANRIYSLVLLTLFSLLFLPTSHTECIVSIPDNSIVILDSNTYHTNMSGVIKPEAITGWRAINVTDGIVYPVMAGGVSINDTLTWREPVLSTGVCGPEYVACFQTNLVSGSVDTDGEMNWLVSSYYETEANNTIHIRVTCVAVSNYEQDCRRTFQLFYYESDTSLTRTVVHSLVSQFLPADTYTDQLTDEHVVLAAFTKSKKGFYIGFLNSIPCAQLTEILIYYFQCPSAVSASGVYSVCAVLSPSPTDVSVSASISCAPTYLRRDPSPPAECYWNGTWRLPAESVCECVAGSYVPAASSSASCVPCPAGSYIAGAGDPAQECTQCPARSDTRGTEGAVECACELSWYRGEGEGAGEPCGQSPSAARNVRVERGTAGLTAVWDEPGYLGNRDASELRYRVSYYRTISPQTESVTELIETQLVLNVSMSTEYAIVVTSLNNLSTLSGVYNEANLTFLSSFPVMINLRYNETSNSLAWNYSLSGEREYVFELSYTSADSNGIASVQVGSSECECTAAYTCVCTVYVRDLNTQEVINFRLFYEVSGELFDTELSDTYGPLISRQLDIELIAIISVGAVIIIVLLLAIVLTLFISVFVFCYRKRVVHSKCDKHPDTPLIQSITSKSIEQSHDQLYQDPSLYEDLNKAIKSLTKELDQRDISIESVIGDGEFGDVCKGTLKINDRVIPVAIKTLKNSSTEKNKQDFFHEASAMGQFTHANVIYLYGVTLSKPIMIVTPYMQNGSLDKFLHTNANTLNLTDLGKICLGVAKGMNYLSRIGFVHRDLAIRNILIDTDFTPKISDFGLSRETLENVYDVKTGGKIPVRWTAPEAILYRKFNMASDVWSFGILLWEVLSHGKPPYGDKDNFTVLEEIQQGYRLEQPESCPYLLYVLMLRCWDTVPELRPTFSELEYELSTMIDSNFMPRPRGRLSRAIQHSPLDFNSIADWLESLKLERYADNFTKNGYTHLSNVWHMTEHDLLAIDIIPVGHRNKIMTSIHKANNKISRTYSVRV